MKLKYTSKGATFKKKFAPFQIPAYKSWNIAMLIINTIALVYYFTAYFIIDKNIELWKATGFLIIYISWWVSLEKATHILKRIIYRLMGDDY